MKFIVCIIGLAVLSTAFSQEDGTSVTMEKRIEFDTKDGNGARQVIKLGDIGFILLNFVNGGNDDMDTYRYDFYDTNLELGKSCTVEMDKKFFMDEYSAIDNMFYQYYSSKKGAFRIEILDCEDMTTRHIEGELPKKTYAKNIRVSGDYLFATLTNKSDEKFIMSINLNDKKKNVVPLSINGVKAKDLKLKRLQMIEDSGEVFAFLGVESKKNGNTTYMVRMGNDGKKSETIKLFHDENIKLIGVSAGLVNNEKIIFNGTYSETKGSAAEGVFYAVYAKNKLEEIKYTKFIDLNEFLSFLPERKQAKIEKKKKKKEKKGKEYVIEYLIADHSMIPVDNGYIFLGEAYFPTYRQEMRTTYVNGKPTTTYVSVFDGYQYTHATLIRYTNDGEILWDKTFEMWPFDKPYGVKRYIRINEEKLDQGEIDMVFASNSRIKSMSVDFNGNVIRDSQTEPLSTLNEGDEVRYSFSNLDYWYDNYFVAYGTEKIKNKEDKDVKKKRKVMFINKIKF